MIILGFVAGADGVTLDEFEALVTPHSTPYSKAKKPVTAPLSTVVSGIDQRRIPSFASMSSSSSLATAAGSGGGHQLR